MNSRKRILLSLLILAAALFYVFRYPIGFRLITPFRAFDPDKIPVAPQYTDLKSWAIHPNKIPQQVAADAPQVFWLHPTSLRSPLEWNENLDDGEAAERFQWALDGQASVFAECCLVFAPHYRQATLASYWRTEDGYKARELAYTDVLRAFDHFIAVENHGRPFFLGGHSQGSEHGLRLLHDRILGTPLQDQLIAAYLIGIPMAKDMLQKTHPLIHVCQDPADTQCLIAYSTFEKNTDPTKFLSQAVWYDEGHFQNVSGGFICVNPVSWKVDGLMTGAQQHRGSRYRLKPAPKVSARCDNGIVFVDNLDSYLDLSLGGNYHLGDYSIFYYDLQENLKTRWQAYNVSHKRP